MFTKIKVWLTSESSIFLVPYAFSFGLIFFNKGLFWDDWTIVGNKPETLKAYYQMVGLPLGGYLHIFILATPFPILLYRAIAFVGFFLSGLCLNEVLKSIKEIGSLERVYLVLIFLLFPVNNLRLEPSVTWYTVCYVLFFSALWMVKKYHERNRLLWRILSLIFLFGSMMTYSIVLFYGVVIAYLFYHGTTGQSLSWTQKIKSLARFPDYIVLPFFVVFCKYTFFIPYGMYSTYNKIEFPMLLDALLHTPARLYAAFMIPLAEAVPMFHAAPLFILVTSLILLSLIRRYPFATESQEYLSSIKGMFAGIIILFLGLFPYFVVNKVPSPTDANSRFQLLMPLGAAFLTFYGASYVFQQLKLRHELRHFFFSGFLALFMACNFSYYLAFQTDWYKQIALVHQFALSEVVKNNSVFLISDKTRDLNANDRIYRDYELFGLLKLAYNDGKSRLALDEDVFLNEPGYRMGDFSNLSAHPVPDPEYRIVIRHNINYRLTPRQTLKLLVQEYFFPKLFEEFISNLLTVTHEKLVP